MPENEVDPPAGPGERWIALSVEAPPRGEELLLAEALRRLGGRGVQREGARIVAFFPPGARRTALAREVAAAIRASTSLADPTVRCRTLAPDDELGLWPPTTAPRQVSERIWVAGPEGDPPGAGAGGVVVRLRPGPAFGSAEHPTTRVCLRLLDRLTAPGVRILDVGTGSGVLAIAAVLLGAERVIALEADAVACRAARGNLAENRVEDRVVLRETEADPASLRSLGRTLGPFGGILANIETGTLLRMMPSFAGILVPEGWLVVGGVPGGEAAAVVKGAERKGLSLRHEEGEAGWWGGAFLEP